MNEKSHIKGSAGHFVNAVYFSTVLNRIYICKYKAPLILKLHKL